MSNGDNSNQSVTVTKAKIHVVDKSGNPKSSPAPLVCMYNPETLQFRKSPQFAKQQVSAKDTATDHRAGGGKATLSVTLLFDTTRDLTASGLSVTAGTSVRQHLKFLRDLLKEDPDNPGYQYFCGFEWGGIWYVAKGFLTSLDIKYILFKSDGTPIRAEASISMEEQATEQELDSKWQNPTSRSAARKTWVVREGDRLDLIAFQEYGNPAHWRHIAETNHIENPFELRPGQILKLVPLP